MSSVESRRLLKANDARPLGGKVAFNFSDIQKSCDDYVAEARERGRQLVEAARAEVEEIRNQAREAGRNEGRAEGLAEAEAEIERRCEAQLESMIGERLRTLIPALKSVARSLEQERDRWLTEWEAAAIRLSVAIAEKILHRRIAADPERGKELILAAVQQTTGQPYMKLRLHPDDRAQLGERAEEVVRGLAACAEATLVADPEITPGGCLIETRHGVIDAQLETQLDRIASELIQEEESEAESMTV